MSQAHQQTLHHQSVMHTTMSTFLRRWPRLEYGTISTLNRHLRRILLTMLNQDTGGFVALFSCVVL